MKERVHPNGGAYRAVRLGGDQCTGVPEAGDFYDFTVACRMHDYGYDLIRVKYPFDYTSVTRDAVDFEFLYAMQDHCVLRSPGDRLPCLQWAAIYYGGVKVPNNAPDDARSWPTFSWPSTQFLCNREFSAGLACWNKGAWGGQTVSTWIYPNAGPWDSWLEFSCSAGGCSIYQDKDLTNLRGDEYLQAKATLACENAPGPDQFCSYGFSVWARKTVCVTRLFFLKHLIPH
ncbi:MAG: phospholipase A2 [Actinomycetota bacterium]